MKLLKTETEAILDFRNDLLQRDTMKRGVSYSNNNNNNNNTHTFLSHHKVVTSEAVELTVEINVRGSTH